MRTRRFLHSLTRNVLSVYIFLTSLLHMIFSPPAFRTRYLLTLQFIHGEFGQRSLLYMRTDIILHFITLTFFERTFPVSSYLLWEAPISIQMRPEEFSAIFSIPCFKKSHNSTDIPEVSIISCDSSRYVCLYDILFFFFFQRFQNLLSSPVNYMLR